jgi:pantoate--beta-alanine ligase
MNVVRKIKSMQQLSRRWQLAGKRIVLVPTMGCLHRGHASLMERARQLAGRHGRVVVSVYVNPKQFGPNEDFARYPRNLKADVRLCGAAGVDVVFAPDDTEMYPADCSTAVEETALAQGMEGAARPGHFRGVTTVVAKLFNAVLPDAAVFGAKDFQQAAVLGRMTRDLNFPVKVVVAPTVREAGGLALSSRNQYLSPAQREQATVLSRAIQRAKEMVAARPVAAAQLRRMTARLVEVQPEARLDYVEFFDPATFQPVKMAKIGTHMALAVFVGKTRLIDNGSL